MLQARRLLGISLRTIALGCCSLGIWNSWKLARADYLSRQDTTESLRSAISLAPDDSEYFMRLAQLDEVHSLELLNTALRLDPYNAQADIELGLQYEAEGNPVKAEELLLQAFAIDHTYLPRWTLANFYLRREDMPAFWTWSRRAAEMPSDDIGALFALCWRVSPDPEMVARVIPKDNPGVIRQYLGFLIGKGQIHAAAPIASLLVRDGDRETDRSLLFSVVNQLVASHEATDANTLWHQLIQQNWVAADSSVPNNAAFARDPLPVSFDWTLSSYSGLHSWPGPSGLEIEFTGDEPESCTMAEQVVALGPGNYTLYYLYHTSDIPPGTGIHWQIIDAKSGTVLADSPDLSSDTPMQSELAFSVGPGFSLLRLRLAYQRTLGTTRVSGKLVIASTQIKLAPSK